jgi:hypothetical protein
MPPPNVVDINAIREIIYARTTDHLDQDMIKQVCKSRSDSRRTTVFVRTDRTIYDDNSNPVLSLTTIEMFDPLGGPPVAYWSNNPNSESYSNEFNWIGNAMNGAQIEDIWQTIIDQYFQY